MSDPFHFTNTTARLGLPYLFPGQAQKEFMFNETLTRLDFLVNPAVHGQIASPPDSPPAGAMFIVAPDGVGLFAGHEGMLACWDGQQWTFLAPQSGMTVFDANDGSRWRFTGDWIQANPPALPEGGQVVDQEARTALSALIGALQDAGIFSR